MSTKYGVICSKLGTYQKTSHHWMLHLYFWNYSTETNPRALKFGGHKEYRSPRLDVQFLSENVSQSCFKWTFNFWCNTSWWMTVLGQMWSWGFPWWRWWNGGGTDWFPGPKLGRHTGDGWSLCLQPGSTRGALESVSTAKWRGGHFVPTL